MATASYDLFRMYCLTADVKLNIKAAGQAQDDAATKTQQNKKRKPCGHAKCSVNSVYQVS